MDKGIIRELRRGHRTKGLNEVKEKRRWENESRELEELLGGVKRSDGQIFKI